MRFMPPGPSGSLHEEEAAFLAGYGGEIDLACDRDFSAGLPASEIHGKLVRRDANLLAEIRLEILEIQSRGHRHLADVDRAVAVKIDDGEGYASASAALHHIAR